MIKKNTEFCRFLCHDLCFCIKFHRKYYFVPVIISEQSAVTYSSGVSQPCHTSPYLSIPVTRTEKIFRGEKLALPQPTVCQSLTLTFAFHEKIATLTESFHGSSKYSFGQRLMISLHKVIIPNLSDLRKEVS